MVVKYDPILGELREEDSSSPSGGSVQPTISGTYTELDALALANGLVVGQTYKQTDFATSYIDPNNGSYFVGAGEPIILTAISTNKFAPVVSSTLYPKDFILYDFASQSLDINTGGFVEYQSGVELSSSYTNMTSITPTATGFDMQLSQPLNYTLPFILFVSNVTGSDDWTRVDTPNALITAGYITIVDNGGNNYSVDILFNSFLGNPYDYNAIVIAGDLFDIVLSFTSTAGTTKGKITHRFDPIQNNRMIARNSLYPYDTADFRGAGLTRFEADAETDYPGNGTGFWSGLSLDLVEEVTGSWGTTTKTIYVNPLSSQVREMFQVYSGVTNFDVAMGVLELNAVFEGSVTGYKNYGGSTSNFLHYRGDLFGVDFGLRCTTGGLFLASITDLTAINASNLSGNFFIASFVRCYMNNATLQNFVTEAIEIQRMKLNNTYLSSFDIKSSMVKFYVDGGVMQLIQLSCDFATIQDLEFIIADHASVSNIAINTVNSFRRNRIRLGGQTGGTFGAVTISAAMTSNDLNFAYQFVNVDLNGGMSGCNMNVVSFTTTTIDDSFYEITAICGNITGLIVAGVAYIYSCKLFGDILTFTITGFMEYMVVNQLIKVSLLNGDMSNGTIDTSITLKTINGSYLNTNINGKSPNGKIRGVTYSNLGVLIPVDII